MNTHEHLSIEILADYAEGLLGDADSTSVAEHLASCADCQAEADLLISVSQILAADDPGPMPEQYAARIDAALAELAAAEPVTPKRSEATTVGGGATVIDLASRRRFTPAARVTSVAASLVLLVGGVALGMQALNNDTSEGPGLGASGIQPTPTLQPGAVSAALYAQRAAIVPTPGKGFKKGKNGALIDKTDGTTYIKNKVLFPDGTVVVKKPNGDAEVRVTSARGEVTRTIVAKSQQTPAPTPNQTTAAATPSPTPASTPKPTPAGDVSQAPNPYVTNSGDAYTEDNFAAKVQSLLRTAGETTGDVSAQSVSGGSAPSPTGQNRVTSQAVRSDDSTAARGDAPPEVVARVKRCADQIKRGTVVAGDAGTWNSQDATILVVREADAKQATGYVVYGQCTKDDPATKANVQWYQQVDVPGPAAEPTPTPTPAPTTNPDTSNGGASQSPGNNVSNGISNGVTTSVAPSVASTSASTTE